MKNKKHLSKELLDDSSKSLIVQKVMTDKANQTLGEVKKDLNKLTHANKTQSQLLDEMLNVVESSNAENKQLNLCASVLILFYLS